jgi:hypothetical protein
VPVALLVVGLVALLYWRTLLPYLGGTEDTPKFQYLGSVLGTAHSPGYPLYIFVSYLFSHLPVGTLAYRINLMSACFGAATALLVFLAARRLGCHRGSAAVIALALAGGRAFWENSTFAEVYTLNAALWAAIVLMLLRWNTSRDNRDLYLATVFMALGLGNHGTILGLFPAAFAFLLLSGRPWLRLRPALSCAAIIAAGLAQYGFIWIRTVQGARYLESQASNMRELIEVMTGRRFAGQMFHLDAHTVATERVPLLWATLRAEMGYIGIAAAGLGLVLLIRKRPAQGMLLAVGALAVFVLTTNVVADVGGFLLPVVVMLWLAAAVGLESVRLAVKDRMGDIAAAATLGLFCVLPVWQVQANYSFNDRHAQSFETRYFKGLFRNLPARSALIIDDYTPTEMLNYGIVSGEFKREGPPPKLASADPNEVRSLLGSGVSVFSFPGGIGALQGYGFEFSRFPLRDLTLQDSLEDVAPGQVVVIGSTGVSLPPGFSRSLDGFAVRGSGEQPVFAIVAVKGTKGFTFQRVATASVTESLSAGLAVGTAAVRLPASVDVSATSTTATIAINGHDVVAATNGVALVVLDGAGRIKDRQHFEAQYAFKDALSMRGWPLVQVTAPNACQAVGDNAWHDITAVSSGAGLEARIDDYRPFDASVVYYFAAASPLRPVLADFYQGCQSDLPCASMASPRLSVDSYPLDAPDGLKSASDRMQADNLFSPHLLTRASSLYRVAVTANDNGQYVVLWLQLGAVPIHAFARAHTDMHDPGRAVICAQGSPAPPAEHEPETSGRGTR